MMYVLVCARSHYFYLLLLVVLFFVIVFLANCFKYIISVIAKWVYIGEVSFWGKLLLGLFWIGVWVCIFFFIH